MKVRTDFVTNSSSSSFTAIKIESKKLAKLLMDCLGETTMNQLELVADINTGTVHTSGKDQSIGQNDIWDEMTTSMPDSINEVIPQLNEAVEAYVDQRGFLFDEGDVKRCNDLAKRLEKMEKELTESIKSVSWQCGGSYWGEMAQGVSKKLLLENGEDGELESIAEDEFLYKDDDIDENEFYDNIDRYIEKLTDEMVEEHTSGEPWIFDKIYKFDRANGVDYRSSRIEFL